MLDQILQKNNSNLSELGLSASLMAKNKSLMLDSAKDETALSQSFATLFAGLQNDLQPEVLAEGAEGLFEKQLAHLLPEKGFFARNLLVSSLAKEDGIAGFDQAVENPLLQPDLVLAEESIEEVLEGSNGDLLGSERVLNLDITASDEVAEELESELIAQQADGFLQSQTDVDKSLVAGQSKVANELDIAAVNSEEVVDSSSDIDSQNIVVEQDLDQDIPVLIDQENLFTSEVDQLGEVFSAESYIDVAIEAELGSEALEEVELDESLVTSQTLASDVEAFTEAQLGATAVSTATDGKTTVTQMAYEDFSGQKSTQKLMQAANLSQAQVAQVDAGQKAVFASNLEAAQPINVFTKAAVDKVAGQFAPVLNPSANANALQMLQNLNLRDAQALQQQTALIQEAVEEENLAKDEEAAQEQGQERGQNLFAGSDSSTTRSGSANASSVPSLASINYGLRHPHWSNAVGKRLVFMVNNQLQQAQITLNPERLGPIQIRLNLDRDQQVSVTMTAQHGATREALEQAIPRLKEMLAEAGIAFDSLEVQDESAFAEGGKQQNNKQQTAGDDGVEQEEAQKVRKYETDNTIDFYA